MIAIRPQWLEWCYHRNDATVMYGDITYHASVELAVAHARRGCLGGEVWDYAELCPMTGMQGPWQYLNIYG